MWLSDDAREIEKKVDQFDERGIILGYFFITQICFKKTRNKDGEFIKGKNGVICNILRSSSA